MIALRQLTAPRTIPWWICVLGLLALYVPTVTDLATNIWSTEEQSQGPVVLAICLWLTWRAWSKSPRSVKICPKARRKSGLVGSLIKASRNSGAALS